MKIATKWKIFALNHHLSDYEGDGVALFDALESESDLEAVFARHDVIVWSALEFMDTSDPEGLADAITGMARNAQEIEGEGVTA